MIQIGKKIKLARKLKHITQEALAQAIGVSDKSISAYESERAHPPINVLEKIAHSTDHPLSYFVGEKEEGSILAKLISVEKQLDDIRRLLKKQK